MKKLTLLTLTVLALSATSAMAVDIDHPHDRIEDKKTIGQAQLKLDIKHMEEELEKMKSQVVFEKGSFDWFHFKGDLRLRYESKEKDLADGSVGPATGQTYQNRYRIRLGSEIDLTDKLHVEVGMRSGYANPTSGNQTFENENLEDYFFESLRFNVLSLSYHVDNTTVKAGRQPYMMYRPIKSQLVWDNDVSLNGVNYNYKDDSKIITLGVNQPTLEEKAYSVDAAGNEVDVNLYIAQYVHKTKLGSNKLNLGAGYYHYDGLKNSTALFSGKDMGNTVDGNKLYTNDYHLAEAFAELKVKEVFGHPFIIAAGVVQNFGADTKNFGYDVAFQYGKAKKPGQLQVKYSYTDLQEDAAYGAYSDSDNMGGGTAARGHAIRMKYKFAKNTYLAGNFFSNERYASKDGRTSDTDYNRVQLDAIFKF